MRILTNKVVAVTGAASGLGQALAVVMAEEGCQVALADVDAHGMKETARMAAKHGRNITAHTVDVSDRERMHRFAKEVVACHGRVDMVVNNAGVSVGASLEEVSYEDFHGLMGINLWGVIHGCKAFLPYLKSRPEAHIVNMCSIHGIITNSFTGCYCTSKFAIRGFTETLIQELKDTPVRVSIVHPGGVKTNIIRNAKLYVNDAYGLSHEQIKAFYDKFQQGQSPERVARVIVTGIKKNKPRILVGPDAYLLDWCKRLFPVGFQKLFQSIILKKRAMMRKKLATL